MPDYTARPYERASDLRLLIEFAQQVTRARPQLTYYHPGDFVWQLYAFDRSDDVRLWTIDETGEIVACAIFEPPLNFQFEVRPGVRDDRGLASDVLRWVEQRRALVAREADIPLAYRWLGTGTLSAFVFDSDAERGTLLAEHGYERAGESGVRFARALDEPLPAVVLPRGARFRSIGDDDSEARAELHRDAWSVWGESKFSIELYRRLRAAPLYDPDLDIVLEHEGQLVSYCVCWLDTANGVGYFEPVGTRSTATGRGFGRAVVREGMRRLKEKGMQTALVGGATVNKPAQALYASAGFEIIEREHGYVKSEASWK
ncbi:MAG: GNAT family N-acetyltransferase [Dehalococcoidia bacterium]